MTKVIRWPSAACFLQSIAAISLLLIGPSHSPSSSACPPWFRAKTASIRGRLDPCAVHSHLIRIFTANFYYSSSLSTVFHLVWPLWSTLQLFSWSFPSLPLPAWSSMWIVWVFRPTKSFRGLSIRTIAWCTYQLPLWIERAGSPVRQWYAYGWQSPCPCISVSKRCHTLIPTAIDCTRDSIFGQGVIFSPHALRSVFQSGFTAPASSWSARCLCGKDKI